MSEISIVVVAYNRADSLNRLLKSLNKVNFMNDKVRLYISIDKDEKNIEKHNKVVKVANDFKWKYGEKIVNVERKNLGLKKHILQCGKLTNEYENVIVLEDDLIVSPLIYIYAKQVLEFYKEEEKIAGFGLYSFQRNPLNNLPFYPMNDGSDVYFMQYACSWGQMWTKNQWNKFYNWYEDDNNEDFSAINIPNNVKSWGSKSWLKYYIKYVIETNKYFVYPQFGLTSNFTDKGTHSNKRSFAYQCTSYYSTDFIKFRFNELSKSNSIYDAFFENIKMNDYLKLDKSIICDFWGERNLEKIKKENYLLSTRDYDYKIVKSYSLEMYPYELNVINNISGNDLKLYDLNIKSKNNKNKKTNLLKYSYKIDMMSRKQVITLIQELVKDICSRIIEKVKRKRK